jgi:hypothetical protein
MSTRTPTGLKAHFKPKLSEWNIDACKLRLLDAIVANWLRGEAGDDITHFRQGRRRLLKEIDDLLNYRLVTQSNNGKRYEPTFLAFCLLLANGNRMAVKLRTVMDHVDSLVRRFLDERPLRLQRPVSEVRRSLLENQRALLLPALQLMTEANMGVYLNNAQASAPDLAFSDAIYRFDSPTHVAWHFLEGYPGLNGWTFAGMERVSVPFDLARLQIAQEVHASASKAVANLDSHPDSAVSHARAALEATFKHILGADHPELKKPFPKQADACREQLRLDGEFGSLGSRIVGTCIAVSDVRNSFGDSHGRSAQDRGATRSEARLSTGTALLLCEFLLDRWESVRSVPALRK